MHRVIGGVAPARPGYRTVRVAPRPGDGITWADTELDSPHGRIAVSWRLAPNGQLDVQLTLPEDVTAEMTYPGRNCST